MRFLAKAKDGKIDYIDKKKLDNYLKKKDGKPLDVDIVEFKEKRSDQQNRYYWGVIVDILSTEIGYEKKEMHNILKTKFLPTKQRTIRSIHGEEKVISISTSTTDLNKEEFVEYNEKIKRWASIHLGIVIPDPDTFN